MGVSRGITLSNPRHNGNFTVVKACKSRILLKLFLDKSLGLSKISLYQFLPNTEVSEQGVLLALSDGTSKGAKEHYTDELSLGRPTSKSWDLGCWANDGEKQAGQHEMTSKFGPLPQHHV